jgi:hypothetical protein
MQKYNLPLGPSNIIQCIKLGSAWILASWVFPTFWVTHCFKCHIPTAYVVPKLSPVQVVDPRLLKCIYLMGHDTANIVGPFTINYCRVQFKCNGTQWCTGAEVKGKLANGVLFTLPRNLGYPALLPLMRTTRLRVVDWTDAHADLNGLVRFAERRNLVSARVSSHFNWPLHPKRALRVCSRSCCDRNLLEICSPVERLCWFRWKKITGKQSRTGNYIYHKIKRTNPGSLKHSFFFENRGQLYRKVL